MASRALLAAACGGSAAVRDRGCRVAAAVRGRPTNPGGQNRAAAGRDRDRPTNRGGGSGPARERERGIGGTACRVAESRREMAAVRRRNHARRGRVCRQVGRREGRVGRIVRVAFVLVGRGELSITRVATRRRRHLRAFVSTSTVREKFGNNMQSTQTCVLPTERARGRVGIGPRQAHGSHTTCKGSDGRKGRKRAFAARQGRRRTEDRHRRLPAPPRRLTTVVPALPAQPAASAPMAVRRSLRSTPQRELELLLLSRPVLAVYLHRVARGRCRWLVRR